ncbi:MAG TPA: hypothetical protein VFS98_00585 [Methylomirabilota bacterium]|nr:hypothetical protein [Methylomirabilota bacterium]
MSHPTRAQVQIAKLVVAPLIAEVVTEWGDPGWLSVRELWETLEHPLRQALIELAAEGLIEADLTPVRPFNQYVRWTSTMHDKAAVRAQLAEVGGA